MADVTAFWERFLAETGRDKETKYVEAFYFGSSEASADHLLRLVLEGKKRATASSKALFDHLGEAVPDKGSLSIVTDSQGVPYCVIETTHVLQMKFHEMTFAICKREGEDDSLDSWRKNHIEFFTWEGQQLGYTFSEELAIVFEDFDVIYVGPENS